MKEMIKMLVVMTAFSLAAGFLLAWADRITKDPIETARKKEKQDALRRVLPPSDNDAFTETNTVTVAGRAWIFHVARKAGAYAGAAFETESEGYGGPIRILVGLQADGAVNAVEILQAEKETPGLGSKVREPSFLRQFRNRKAADTRWCAVRKDGGEIQAITGATISSRAVSRAVKAGLDVYAANAAKIRETRR